MTLHKIYTIEINNSCIYAIHAKTVTEAGIKMLFMSHNTYLKCMQKYI